MGVINKIVKRNLTLNKKRSITTIVGIVLSVALICALGGLFTSFKATLVQNAINETGYYHIALDGIKEDDVLKYQVNKDVSKITCVYRLGVSEYKNTNPDNPYTYIYATNQDSFKQLSYKLIEGNYPTNKQELVVSRRMALYGNIKVGDKLKLNIGTRLTSDGYELDENNPFNEDNDEYLANVVIKEYQVVGIVNRECDQYEVYAITTNESSNDIMAYLTLDNPNVYQESFVQLLKANSYEEVQWHNIDKLNFNYEINNELLRWEVFAFSDSTISMFTTLAAVVIFIIVLVSIFCIRNSFAISTSEKMKLYGMLASVGASKKQLKQSVLLEGLILGLIAIPLGIILGIIAVFVLIKVVNCLLGNFMFNSIDGIVFDISIIPLVIAILLGFITIYFASLSSAIKASKVSPIDNLRNSNEISLKADRLKTGKLIRKIFKIGGVLAYKNLKRSKKKYRTTIISLTISIFVFITMSYFVQVGFEQTNTYYHNYAYNVVVTSGVDMQFNHEIDLINHLSEVDDSYLLYEYRGPALVSDQSKINYIEGYDDLEQEMYIGLMALDSNSFKQYVSNLGLDYDKVKMQGVLIDEIEYYGNSEDDSSIKKQLARRYQYEANDIIDLALDENKVSIKIAQVSNERPYGLENSYNNQGYLVVDEANQEINFTPYKLMLNTKDSEQLVKNINLVNSELNITDLSKQANSEKMMVIVISIFLYGFIGVITLIGLTNIFNTLTSNMELRQKEFAMLKSIGMTNKEFKQMINLETLFYCSKSLIIGIVLGLIGSYAIYLGYAKRMEISYHLPLTAIIISIIFVFIIVYLIMRYAMAKINKQNTIETIRNDNI